MAPSLRGGVSWTHDRRYDEACRSGGRGGASGLIVHGFQVDTIQKFFGAGFGFHLVELANYLAVERLGLIQVSFKANGFRE